jgi:8-oxo-dGTP diphosphatase
MAIVLVAAAALIDADGRVLIARRPQGKVMAGLWEFPGGKVKIDVTEACLAPLTFASHAYADFHLLMPLYVCRRWQGIVTAREGQELAWVRPKKLCDYAMPPADAPLIPHLIDLL